MPKRAKSELTKWLDAIQKLLIKDGKSIADLARDLKMPSQYIQVYRWIVSRKPEPKGEATIGLIKWALARNPSLIKLLKMPDKKPDMKKVDKFLRKRFSR